MCGPIFYLDDPIKDVVAKLKDGQLYEDPDFFGPSARGKEMDDKSGIANGICLPKGVKEADKELSEGDKKSMQKK